MGENFLGFYEQPHLKTLFRPKILCFFRNDPPFRLKTPFLPSISSFEKVLIIDSDYCLNLASHYEQESIFLIVKPMGGGEPIKRWYQRLFRNVSRRVLCPPLPLCESCF